MPELLEEVESVPVAEADVQNHDVTADCTDGRKCFIVRGCLGDDLPFRQLVEDAAEAGADDRVIVDDHDPLHARIGHVFYK